MSTASRLAWLMAQLTAFYQARYTGKVGVKISFYQGGIRAVDVSKEGDTSSAP